MVKTNQKLSVVGSSVSNILKSKENYPNLPAKKNQKYTKNYQ